jgi:hypothetical protein
MVSLRQIAGVLWGLSGFMIVAGLVLNMRHKSVGDGTTYLDTWTGRTHQVTQSVAPAAERRSVEEVTRVEIEAIEGLACRVREKVAASGSVSFAFPAPEGRVVVIRREAPAGSETR